MATVWAAAASSLIPTARIGSQHLLQEVGTCSGSLRMLPHPSVGCKKPHSVRSFHGRMGGGGHEEVKIRKEKEEITLEEMGT